MTEQFPEPEPEPDVLLRLSNAMAVLRTAHEAVEAEASAAAQSVIDAQAAHLARCRSVVWQLTAEAYEIGFTSSQIATVLGEKDDLGRGWRHI